jgi:hypothetical protein
MQPSRRLAGQVTQSATKLEDVHFANMARSAYVLVQSFVLDAVCFIRLTIKQLKVATNR